MVVRQFVGLLRYRLCDFSPAVPDVDAVETSKAIDVTASLRVLDPDAFTSRDDCGIAQLATCEFLELSGGMQKRVGLARALQLNPEMMLFDEPTTGLDPVMTQEIYHLFARTQALVGYTSVIVSHDIPKVLNLADHVIILNDGKADEFESPEENQWSGKEHIREFVKTTMGQIYQSHLMEK